MNIKIGTTTGDESIYTNAIVMTSRQKTASSYKLLDGSVKVQEAPLVKRIFDITLVNPTSAEVTKIETEYDKGTTLKFVHNGTIYIVKFIGNLDKSTGAYEIIFFLQEV